MYYKHYSVAGKHKDTGRKRTINISAISLEQCKEKAADEGILEPYEITEYPPSLPSERQLAYAKDLGIKIPENATFKDISALLDRKQQVDNLDPQQGLIDYANAREFEFSKYIGKKALYNLIFYKLSGKDKIAFFIFCVYRWLSDDRESNLDTHKYKDKFYELADKLTNDDKFVKSMNRYEGEEIRFFGALTSTNGEISFGGSTETIAYKTASEILCKDLNLKNRKVKTLPKTNENIDRNQYKTSKKNGCLTLVLLIILLNFLLFLVFKI